MRVHEFAKAHNVSSAEVLAAATLLNLPLTSAGNSISAEQAESLEKHFAQGDKSPAGSDTETSDAGSAPSSQPALPPSKVHRYVRRRGVKLPDVLTAMVQLEITPAHRHRDLTPDDVQALDDWFASQA